MIRSGAVFVFSVEESGIKRWTEGLAWSQSRISGNFLVSVAHDLLSAGIVTIREILLDENNHLRWH